MAAPAKKKDLAAPSQRLDAIPPYMFAELERRIEAEARRGHRRDQPRDRGPGHSDLPLRRRGDAGGRRRPGRAEVPEQSRAPGVPRGVRGLLPSALRGRDRCRERGDSGDRGEGVHLQPLLRLPRSRRRRPGLGSRLPGLYRRAGSRRRRGTFAASPSGPRLRPGPRRDPGGEARGGAPALHQLPEQPDRRGGPRGLLRARGRARGAPRDPGRPRQRLLRDDLRRLRRAELPGNAGRRRRSGSRSSRCPRATT